MYQFAIQTFPRYIGFLGVLAPVTALGNLLLCCQPVDHVSPGLLGWWTALCVVSIGNIWMWGLSAEALAKRKGVIDPEVFAYQRRQLILSAVYVLGCAFRALVPRADVQRIGLFDTWVSSILVGRSVATVAELCFAAQWSLCMLHLAQSANCRAGTMIARLLVPLIVIAEISSWYAVITTSYIGNAIEESIWTIAATLLVVGFCGLWPRSAPAVKSALAAAIMLGTAYVAYMCSVDVPMYLSRWHADEAAGREYLSVSQGLWDLGSRWVVTHAWDEWHPEIPWMSLYFSVGVWCSLALVHFPRLDRTRP